MYKINNKNLIEGVEYVPSPNRGNEFVGLYPDNIIIHFTSGSSGESSLSWLTNPQSNASAHVLIYRDGTIKQMVPFNIQAWHAGRSHWKGKHGLNRYTLGIEIDNAGPLTKVGDHYESWFKKQYSEDEVYTVRDSSEREYKYWHDYTEKQIDVVFNLCVDLVYKYQTIKNILGHEEISPGRKVDPGPAFPLDKLREWIINKRQEINKYGFIHETVDKFLQFKQ